MHQLLLHNQGYLNSLHTTNDNVQKEFWEKKLKFYFVFSFVYQFHQEGVDAPRPPIIDRFDFTLLTKYASSLQTNMKTEPFSKSLENSPLKSTSTKCNLISLQVKTTVEGFLTEIMWGICGGSDVSCKKGVEMVRKAFHTIHTMTSPCQLHCAWILNTHSSRAPHIACQLS